MTKNVSFSMTERSSTSFVEWTTHTCDEQQDIL